MSTSCELENVFGRILLHEQVGETEFIVIQLAYHVELLVNPTLNAGYDDRYCIHSVEVAAKAIEKFRECGEIRFWQKHHNKRLRVSGSYLFHDNVLCIPENAILAQREGRLASVCRNLFQITQKRDTVYVTSSIF